MPSDVVIDVRKLSFAYSASQKVLRDVSFHLGSNESLGIVGPNGAGKTTLLLCLTGVLPVPPGVVRVTGFDPGVPAQRRQLPAHVGIVFQDADDQLFNTTVQDDVAFGPLNLGCSQEEAQKRVEEALAWVGAQKLAQRVPHRLSGGEKRRVALAGVLAMRPQILLLDEPSLHLDPRGRRELIDLIRRLSGARIVASHDLELVLQTCGRVLVLDEGQTAADGPTADILSNGTLMESHSLEVPWSLRKSKD